MFKSQRVLECSCNNLVGPIYGVVTLAAVANSRADATNGWIRVVRHLDDFHDIVSGYLVGDAHVVEAVVFV